MKKGIINGLLALVVLVIWLFVFRKASVSYKKGQENLGLNVTQNNFKISDYSKDTFQLKKFNRDPFLDFNKNITSTISKVNNTLSPVKTTRAIPVSNSDTKLWPKIEYMGYIKKSELETRLALIRINNKLFRAREKETIEDIYIKQVFKDSVILRWGVMLKTILK